MPNPAAAHAIAEMISNVRKLHGWRVEDSGKAWKVYPPQGRVIFASKAPSDTRAVRNIRAELRRAGATGI